MREFGEVVGAQLENYDVRFPGTHKTKMEFFDFRDRPPADPQKSNFCNILKSQSMGVNVGMRQKKTLATNERVT